MIEIKNLIAGELVAPAAGEFIDNYAPATDEVYSKVPNSNAGDVNQAVAAAKTAFQTWSKTPKEERVRLMMKLADLIERDAEKLARAESAKVDFPLPEPPAIPITIMDIFVPLPPCWGIFLFYLAHSAMLCKCRYLAYSTFLSFS